MCIAYKAGGLAISSFSSSVRTAVRTSSMFGTQIRPVLHAYGGQFSRQEGDRPKPRQTERADRRLCDRIHELWVLDLEPSLAFYLPKTIANSAKSPGCSL